MRRGGVNRNTGCSGWNTDLGCGLKGNNTGRRAGRACDFNSSRHQGLMAQVQTVKIADRHACALQGAGDLGLIH